MSSPSPILLPDERQRLILDRLAEQGRVLAADLARDLGASEDTIRRDLREMASRGACQRVYGGALAMGRTLAERTLENPDRKAALARMAASIVEPGQLLFLDAGSTNLAIARALSENASLTVATNAPSTAMALYGRPGIALILIGGLVDGTVGGAIGAKAIRDVEALRVDLCFLGACSLSEPDGVGAFVFEDAEFKQALVRSSRSVAIAVTTEKLGASAPYHVADANEIRHLVLERDAAPGNWKPFERAGAKIHQLPA
jgi:DeoR/GlpR family transcriptional regulator of sugar metabolism